MEHPLRRFLRFVSSPNYSRTFSLLVLLLVLAAVPLTVYVGQQRQELRQRATQSEYACNRPTQHQAGNDTGDCDAGNGCTGTLYAQYSYTDDTNDDGTADPNDPDDQPMCVDSACSAPITCPTPTPEPTATPQPPAPTATTAPPPPTSTPVPPQPTTPPCIAWNESTCSQPGGTRCSNWGAEGYCGWSQAKWNTCRLTTCAVATPTPAVRTDCYVCGTSGWRLRGNTGICSSNTPPQCQIGNDNNGQGCTLGPGMQLDGQCELPPNLPTPTSVPTATPVPTTPPGQPTGTPVPTAGPGTPTPTTPPGQPTSTPGPTAPPSFELADFNHSGCVGQDDFEVWRQAFQSGVIRQGTFPDVTGPSGTPDSTVTLHDFNFWFNAMLSLSSDKLCR